MPVKLPLKGVPKAPTWYVSYAMLMKPSKSETAVHWLLIDDRVKWLCACVICWPHRVSFRACHLTFFSVVFHLKKKKKQTPSFLRFGRLYSRG